MELEELIENILRRKYLEEMMDSPEKEHTPLKEMDNKRIKRFALFLEENQNKSKQLDEMIARLDEIGKDLKESNKKIDSLANALLKANSRLRRLSLNTSSAIRNTRHLRKSTMPLLNVFLL